MHYLHLIQISVILRKFLLYRPGSRCMNSECHQEGSLFSSDFAFWEPKSESSSLLPPSQGPSKFRLFFYISSYHNRLPNELSHRLTCWGHHHVRHAIHREWGNLSKTQQQLKIYKTLSPGKVWREALTAHAGEIQRQKHGAWVLDLKCTRAVIM